MKILAWNVCGLNSPDSVTNLKHVIRKYRPQIVFLCETKLSGNQVDDLRIKCGDAECRWVPSEGASGGLVLLWQAGISIERCTGFYGEPNVSRRPIAWNLLRELATQFPLPWLVLGDFNEIMLAYEKKGGNTRIESQMENFRQALDDCLLMDLGYEGLEYTWDNGRKWPCRVRERLDRAIASIEWTDILPNYQLTHLPEPFSDHFPLLLNTLGTRRIQNQANNPKRFKFEQCWIGDPECETIIYNIWSSGMNSNLP